MADAPDDAKAAEADALKVALQREDVPKIYANGFSVGLSNADVIVILQRFGQNPVAVVNLSYTLAKTLAQRLGRLVSEFERVNGEQDILTTDRIDEAFKKDQERSSSQKSDSEDNVH